MHRAALAVLLVAVAACDSAPALDDGAELQTDASAYLATLTSWGVEFEAELTYTNTSDRTVYFTGCVLPTPPALEKRVDGEWVVVYGPVVPLCLRSPLAVAPGGAVNYTARVAACTGDRCAPEWQAGPAPRSVPGTYRLRTSVATEVNDGLPVRSRDVVSNAFRLGVLGGAF